MAYQKYYSSNQIAALWGVHRLTILEEIKRGRLKSFRIGPAKGRAPHRVSDEERLRYERDNARGVDVRSRLTPRQKAGGAA